MQKSTFILQCNKSLLTHCRLLGVLCEYLSRDVPGFPAGPEKPVDSISKLFIFHLNNKSAVQRFVIGQVAYEWANASQVGLIEQVTFKWTKVGQMSFIGQVANKWVVVIKLCVIRQVFYIWVIASLVGVIGQVACNEADTSLISILILCDFWQFESSSNVVHH